jgi:hypothetical protein
VSQGGIRSVELTEKVVEQFAAVFVGVEALVNVGLESGVDVSVV